MELTEELKGLFRETAKQLSAVNAAADADPTVLRISMDAKATVKVGDFSRGGKKRMPVKAADHDAQGKGEGDSCGHFASRARRIVSGLCDFQSDQRLSGRYLADVVAERERTI